MKSRTWLVLAMVVFSVAAIHVSASAQSLDVVDVLSYIIGDPQNWGRRGSHQMNQVVKGNSVTFVKFADPEWWERWTWDDQYIYHYEDHSARDPYVFSDGRWAKRFMRVGETLPMDSNMIQYYRRSDCSPVLLWSFAYEMQLVARYDRYDAGGSIGVADVIVLKYDPTVGQRDRGGDYELFFFAKGWGWFKWESWHYNNNTLTQRSVFNQTGGQPTWPNSGCRAHPEFSQDQYLQPELYYVRPDHVRQGEVLTLFGKNLSSRVQFLDALNRAYDFGSRDGVQVLGDRSQVSVLISSILVPGVWRVRVFSDRGYASDTQAFTIVEPPVFDRLPVGVLDAATCAVIGGWAVDLDAPSASVDVHIYKDNPGAPGSFVAALTTAGLRPDVNAAYKISGYHGFTFTTPASLHDGRTHLIYVYAINDKRDGQNPLIMSSPKTVTCPQ